ncbi:MAG TPA: DUF4388 domain-containing protein [Pyrinomonadaceae bacterium]|nr:DUF4388 domain-containing protein [Pyrinomonadaceae bacterium]
MENIERTQFVVLTGHLDDQPLSELMRRLRAQRKSGRLQVEYSDGPASFFFDEGLIVDARMGNLRGVEALYAALELGGGSFNFNPLVRPPEKNIDEQGRRFIEDLIEAPRRDGLAEIRAEGRGLEAAPPSLHLQQNPARMLPSAAELTAPLEERLTAVEGAIVSASNRFSRERLVYAVVIGFLVGLSLITTVNVLYGPFFRKPAPAAVAAPPAPQPTAAASTAAAAAANEKVADARAPGAEESASPQTAQASVPAAAAVVGSRRVDGAPVTRREYVVEVLVEVKNGAVTDARVWNPRPGAAAYESVAVKMARERSYPAGFTGGERLRIRVKP